MRVCMFTECYFPTINGVVVSVNTFRRQLERLGANVDIVAPRYRGFREADDHVIRLPSFALPWRPEYPLQLPWHSPLPRLRGRDYDVIHVHSPFLAGRLGRIVARRRELPLVFTFHTIYEKYVHYVPLPAPLARYWARARSRGFAQACDAVVAPSEGIREMLQADGVTSRIEVIQTGLDLPIGDSGAEPPGDDVRAEWGIAADAPLFAYVGRVASEKSTDLLLAAFAEIVKATPAAVLMIVGGGPWERHMHALAARLGIAAAVRFTGALPRPQALRCAAAADIFLFASVTETQGLVVLEAMSVGTPCVAARSGALTGVVRDGVNGVLVEHDAPALARAAIALARDPERRARLAAAARDTAKEFSAEAMARRLFDLYQSLVESGRGHETGG